MVEAQQDSSMAQLGQQMRELVDRNEITDLVSRLGLWLDEKRFDEARSIFTEDVAVQTPGGEARGIELVAGQARRNHAAFERTQHVITNVLVDLDGDRATVQANLTVTFVQRADMPEPHFTLGERYHFDAARTPQGWRISGIRVSPVWRAGQRDAAPLAPLASLASLAPASSASPASSAEGGQ